MAELIVVLDKNMLEYAYRLYNKNIRCYFLVSGWQQKTSSILMKNYLIRRGIPGEQIYEEALSTNLIESFLFCKEFINNSSKKTVPYSNERGTGDFQIIQRKKFPLISKIYVLSRNILCKFIGEETSFIFKNVEMEYHVQLSYRTEIQETIEDYRQKIRLYKK